MIRLSANGKMNHDQIIGEVRATRERLAAERGYDIRALYEEAKRREQEGDREIADLEPRHFGRGARFYQRTIDGPMDGQISLAARMRA